eukprot:GFUD01025193.1.p1 GENE.GFUD01025193.1~~GFUD01025193.1.p1  ORF type:complete len:503 (+),score=169.79 GFUD01025193.1:81-1589(+)
MKRTRATPLKKDVNSNIEEDGDGMGEKKAKADFQEKEISSLMKKASSEVSKFHSNRIRGKQCLDPLYEAVRLYEKASLLAESAENQLAARKAFLQLGETLSDLAESEALKTNQLENYKRSLTSCGKSFGFCLNLQPGPTARSVQKTIFKVIGQVSDFVKTIDSESKRNICLEQAVRCLKVESGHWLEEICLAKARLVQAEMLNDSAVVSISNKEFKQGIYLLSEMYRPLELTRGIIEKLQNDGKGMVVEVKKMEADLAIIRMEYKTHTAMAQGLQAMSMAENVVEDAVRGGEEMSVELVWSALDLYKQAALVSGDVEVEAHARGKTGLVYLNILKMEEIAKAYLGNAMDLAKTLQLETSVNLYTFSWYPEVAQAWKLLQDEVVRREEDLWTKEKKPLLNDKEVRRSLKLIESEEIESVVEFAEFLFDYFEPDHLKEKVTFEIFKKEAESKGFLDDEKKMLLKLIIHWHPDKVSKETEENKKWYIICEEITKKLTAKYSLMKI